MYPKYGACVLGYRRSALAVLFVALASKVLVN